MDLDATDRYGFVMPPNGAQGPATPNGEPGVRERDLESKRVLKWRKMLGVSCDLFNVDHLGILYVAQETLRWTRAVSRVLTNPHCAVILLGITLCDNGP